MAILYKQTDRLIRITILKADGTLETASVAAWTVELRLGLTRGATGDLVKTMSLESDVTKTFTVTLSAAETLALAERIYRCTVKRIDSSAKEILYDGELPVQDTVRGTA